MFDEALYVTTGDALHRLPLSVFVSAEPSEAPPRALSLGAVVPNPTTDAARVALTGPPGTEATVRVIDVLGRSVGVERVRLSAEEHVVHLPAGLAPGLYVVHAEAAGEARSRRFVVGR